MPGPPPNPASRRSGRTGLGFVSLPTGGPTTPAPPYPLTPSPDDGCAERRAALWAALWATPQAALWQAHCWTMPQARYVEALLAWEEDPRGVSAALMGEVRQLETALALSAAGLLRARAVIAEASAGAVVRHLASVDLSGHGPGVVDLTAHAQAQAQAVEPADLDDSDDPGPAC